MKAEVYIRQHSFKNMPVQKTKMARTIEEILEDLRAQRELLDTFGRGIDRYQANVNQLLAHLERRDLPKIHKTQYQRRNAPYEPLMKPDAYLISE